MAIGVAVELFEDDASCFLGTVLAPDHMDEDQIQERLVDLQQEWLDGRDAETPNSDFIAFLKDHAFRPDPDELLFYTVNAE